MKKNPEITGEMVRQVFDSPFVRLYDLQYAKGKHYYDASRREKGQLAATMDREQFRQLIPDGVNCIVIIEETGKEPRLLFSKEFRYPLGRFLLSVPAGLIDPDDQKSDCPAITAAIRELREETGIELQASDQVSLITPAVISTPGMSDETNAMVCAIIRRDGPIALSQDGAEGSEIFDGFLLLTREEVLELLQKGTDPEGIFLPIHSWSAMLYFLSDLWK